MLPGEEVTLDEVRAMLDRQQGRRLPGLSSDVLFNRLIQQSINPWRQCAADYFEEVKTLVTDAIDELCKHTFGRYTKSGLFAVVK
jgi:hypothetical protein